MFKFQAVVRLMRPKQWVKNTFVFAPLLFTGRFNDPSAVGGSALAFLIFCLAASSAYIFNDYRDIEGDKNHPVKSNTRPLASGEISPSFAFIALAMLYSVVLFSAVLHTKLAMVAGGYIMLNIAYSLYLKHLPVVDIFTIAAGFVLRVYAGAVALDVPLSSWMFITSFALALYLAAIKRRQELLNVDSSTRGVLRYYTVSLVDKYAEMSATCAILFYSLFIITDKPNMVYTIPFVLFGLYRYWLIVESTSSGESPTDVLFADTMLQLTILAWVAACAYSLSNV